MATVINNPDSSATWREREIVRESDTGSGVGVVVGILLAILFIFLFVIFGLPGIRPASTAPATGGTTNNSVNVTPSSGSTGSTNGAGY